jgi:ubiquinone/menaquinone biosynthesis C-methylase UbiE
VGLDVQEPIEVRGPHGVGRLLAMNAEQLDFADSSFDLVFSISTFEHVDDVAKVLAEITRVLKPGGTALVSFEPIWTCSYGHHLHHFGPVSKLMPDWAHLVWDKARMLSELAPVWPPDASPTLEEAAHWVYESNAINRIPLARMRQYFATCGLHIEWTTPLPDDPRDPRRLREVSERLSIPEDDLMTKGLSVLLNKV